MALGAPGVAGMVSHHKQAPLCNGIQKFPFLLLLLNVFNSTTHQVPRMATFGDRQLGARVAESTGGPLPTPPGPFKLKLFREFLLRIKFINDIKPAFFIAIWVSGGSGEALGGALVALEAPGVAGMVSLHKQAPLRNGIQKCPSFVAFTNCF